MQPTPTYKAKHTKQTRVITTIWVPQIPIPRKIDNHRKSQSLISITM